MRPGPAPRVRLAHGGGLSGGWASPGVAVFRGIRFARAPAGPLRFAAPEPQPGWHGTRAATDFAPLPPQWPRAGGGADMAGAVDCLAVNVWTPAPDAAAGLPVMVWVPGGGFMRGGASDPLYDGAAIARRGVVVVSLQYRLGVDGFMHFGDEAPANRGLLDVLAALRWVREHIAAFGGDPDRVTVFGESAGAGAIACLLGMPEAQGLFGRAILQSPSVACQSVHEAAVVRRAVAGLLGVPPTLQGVGGAPLAPVLHAVHRLAADASLRARCGIGQRNFFPLRPVVDGTVLRQPPLAAMAAQWQARRSGVQILVGSNAEEMRLYHAPHGGLARITREQLEGFMRDVGLPPGARALYAALPGCEGGTHAGEMLCAMQSDYYYRAPARRVAAIAHACGLAAHLYELEWRSPQWGGALGAAHGVDLPFVFGNLDTPTGRELTGEHPPHGLSEAMQGAWVRFAQCGDPGWPAHGAAGWTQYFGEPPRCAQEALAQRLRVWEELL